MSYHPMSAEFKHLLSLLVEGLEDTAVCLLDDSGRVRSWNGGAERLYGYASGEIVGEPYARLFRGEEIAAGLPESLLARAAAEGSHTLTGLQRRSSGAEFWAGSVLVALREPGGRAHGFGLVVRDRTNQRQSEEECAAFHALGLELNGVTTPQQAARVVLDMADRLVGWDACWLELCGADERTAYTVVLIDEIDGKRQDCPPAPGTRDTCPLARRAFREGPLLLLRERDDPNDGWAIGYNSFGDDARISNSLLVVPIRRGLKPVGALSIQSYAFQAYSEADLELLVALADYCAGALDRTLAEAARQDLEQQLLQVQRLEAVGRLAGGVAHDFNNMLAVINGYSALLLRMVPHDSPAREGLSEIANAGERAAELTRQLLAFGRKQILEPCEVQMNEVVGRLRGIIARLIGEDVELVVVLEPRAGAVRVDPSQLDQIVVNLAANARDAMPLGGQLSIETKRVELDSGYTRFHPEVAPGEYVQLSVADTGCGMTAEVLEQIWEPFFTTKAVGKGTGLGLATVYGIVKQSGGHVEVESRLGEGTTFRIFLPRLDTVSEAAEEELPELLGAPGHGTVLLVEDEAMLRRLAETILRDRGYRVLTAGHAAEARRVAELHTGPIDLLLTDVVLPAESGRVLSEQLREARPGLKVLFMTGYTDDAVLRYGVEMSQVALLHKPFTPRDLLRAVEDALERSPTSS